jgi:hypothetical protein
MNTTDPRLTELYKSAELKTYTSISSLSSATGIPKPLLKASKRLNAPGFGINATVNWSKLKNWFELHYTELTSPVLSDVSTLKNELLRQDIQYKKLQVRKLERNLLEPEDVKALLVELATKQSVIIKAIFNELPIRLAGKSEPDIKIALEQAQKEIFSVFMKADSDVNKLSK